MSGRRSAVGGFITLGKLLTHISASISKHYCLVAARGQWCSEAGKNDHRFGKTIFGEVIYLVRPPGETTTSEA